MSVFLHCFICSFPIFHKQLGIDLFWLYLIVCCCCCRQNKFNADTLIRNWIGCVFRVCQLQTTMYASDMEIGDCLTCCIFLISLFFSYTIISFVEQTGLQEEKKNRKFNEITLQNNDSYVCSCVCACCFNSHSLWICYSVSFRRGIILFCIHIYLYIGWRFVSNWLMNITSVPLHNHIGLMYARCVFNFT